MNAMNFNTVVNLIQDGVDDTQISLRLGITIKEVQEVRDYIEEEYYADFD